MSEESAGLMESVEQVFWGGIPKVAAFEILTLRV